MMGLLARRILVSPALESASIPHLTPTALKKAFHIAVKPLAAWSASLLPIAMMALTAPPIAVRLMVPACSLQMMRSALKKAFHIAVKPLVAWSASLMTNAMMVVLAPQTLAAMVLVPTPISAVAPLHSVGEPALVAWSASLLPIAMMALLAPWIVVPLERALITQMTPIAVVQPKCAVQPLGVWSALLVLIVPLANPFVLIMCVWSALLVLIVPLANPFVLIMCVKNKKVEVSLVLAASS
jgi:hypothetical protein